MALPLYEPSGTQLTDRQQANAADPDAFGAGVGRAVSGAGNQLAGLGAKMMEIEAKQKAADDATAVIDADMEASKRLRQGLYGDGGVFTRTGKNADGVTLTTEELTQTIGADISKRFSDPAQQRAFDQMWGRRTEATLDGAAKHEFSQRSATRTATKTAALANINDDVVANYNDDEVLATNFDAARAIIRANPDGLPNELLDQMERESISTLTLSVIQRKAQDNPGEALEYYEKNKSKVSGADHAAADRIISGVQTIRDAGQAATEIYTSSAGDAMVRATMTAEHHGKDPTDINVAGRVSSAGAAGPMQVMGDTAREEALALGMKKVAGMSDDELQAYWRTPEGYDDNIRIGGSYLTKMLSKYKGDAEAAWVGYNAGSGNADKWLNAGRDYSVLPRPEETLPYVKRALGAYKGIEINGETSEDIQRALKGEGPSAYYQGDAGAFLKTVLQKQHGADHIDGMKPAMQDRLAALFSGAPPEVKDGLDILSGTRSLARQKELWDASDKTGKRVARPGGSRHNHGDAADLGWKGGKFSGAPENVKQWVHANAAAYGLNFPMSYEPWHIETTEARKGGKSAGKGSKPSAKDIYKGGQPRVDQTKDDAVGTVTIAPPPAGSAADIYAKSVAPFSVNMEAGNLDDWLTTARQRHAGNPSLLAEVERQLGDEHKLRENRQKEEIETGMREVFRGILGGKSVKDVDPALLEKLGVENVGKLLTAESKFIKGADDVTDDAAYYRITKLTPEEFEKYDLLQDVDKLSGADLRSFADKQAGLRRGDAKTAAKRSTDLTRTQLMTSAENILALDPSSDPAHAKTMYELNRQLDGRISVFMANNGGKEPDGNVMRDMLDELLLEGTVRDRYMGGLITKDRTARVFEMSTADKAGASFAQSVDEIPPDVQPAIGRGYRAIYKTAPNEESAVQFYNDMMRVRLGGTPAPPELLDARIRQGLIKQLGRAPTAEEIANFYSAWMAKATAEPDG